MKPAQILCGVLAVAVPLVVWPAGAGSSLALDLTVQLDPVLDRFGSQIETVQVYEDADGQRATFGIYDTGASVITISAYDQMFLRDFVGTAIPIKVYDGASAEGIGGTLTGDVSMPGTIRAAGIEAVQFTDFFDMNFDLSKAAFVPGGDGEHGVQAFVGTPDGSPYLSTITGTPIHNGRLGSDPDAPNGIAAKINMQWDLFDLGSLLGGFDEEWGNLFKGITLSMPNVEFVAPGTKLEAIPDDDTTPLVDETSTAPVRVPLALFGEDNHENPGDMITSSYNPIQNTGVVLSHDGVTVGGPDDKKTMLFDTGSMLTIMSTEMAKDLLGFDPDPSTSPFSVEVQGAAGGIGRIPGYTIDALELPVDDDGDGTPDGKVRFEDVPIFVYDVTPAEADPEEGLDGILGMNLFNTAAEMVYDPFDPSGASLSLTFLENPYREDLDPGDLGLFEDFLGSYAEYLELLGLEVPDLEAGGVESLLQFVDDLMLLAEAFNGQSYPWLASPIDGSQVPGSRTPPAAIPEPSTLVLLALGAVTVLLWRFRRRRAA